MKRKRRSIVEYLICCTKIILEGIGITEVQRSNCDRSEMVIGVRL